VGPPIFVLIYALTRIYVLGHVWFVLATFTALGEPNRYRIVELLRSGPRAVNDIGERLKLNQPQVSKHLRVLKDAGIVDVHAHAQQRVYELRAARLRELADWLARYKQIWQARFDELDALIDEIKAKENAHGRRRRPPK
jgi:DNA-binding transcriptional ArsR family regulator